MKTNGEPVKLLITYDPDPGQQEDYFQYVLGEFVPSMQRLGLPMSEVWHTAYGDYPLRLAAFVAPDWTAMQEILDTATFQDLERRLQQYVSNYERRVVLLKNRFQF